MPWKYLRMTRRRTCDTLNPRRKRTEDEAAAPIFGAADFYWSLDFSQILNLSVLAIIGQNVAYKGEGKETSVHQGDEIHQNGVHPGK